MKPTTIWQVRVISSRRFEWKGLFLSKPTLDDVDRALQHAVEQAEKEVEADREMASYVDEAMILRELAKNAPADFANYSPLSINVASVNIGTIHTTTRTAYACTCKLQRDVT